MSILSAVGKAVGDGLTLAAEILCPRDHSCEDRLRSWESASVAVEDEICDEAEADEDYLFTTTWADYHRQKALADLNDARWCRDHQGILGNCRHLHYSAAVSAAADPSPADNHHASRGAGDEGRKEDSCIPPPASFRHPIDEWDPIATLAVLRDGLAAMGLEILDDGGLAQRFRDLAAAADPESDPREVSAPSLGESTRCGICFGPTGQCDCTSRLFGDSVLEDDLAAHIMGDFVSGQDVDPLTATLIDAISTSIARALLTDFNITRKK